MVMEKGRCERGNGDEIILGTNTFPLYAFHTDVGSSITCQQDLHNLNHFQSTIG